MPTALNLEARRIVQSRGLAPTADLINREVVRLSRERKLQAAQQEIAKTKQQAFKPVRKTIGAPVSLPQTGGTGALPESPITTQSQSFTPATLTSPSVTETSPITQRTGGISTQVAPAPQRTLGFTPDAFESQLRTALQNELSTQTGQLRGALQTSTGQYLSTPETLAGLPGFENLTIDQLRGLQGVERRGLGALISGVGGLAEQRQTQFEKSLGAATSGFERAQERKAKETEKFKPIEIGGELIQLQPDGTYKSIYTGKQKSDIQFVPPQFNQLGEQVFPPSVFDKNTQTLIPIGGGQPIPASQIGVGTGQTKGYLTPPPQGFRTDRHNNPTAFIVDIAKQAGLKEGVDYERGDPFTTESGQTLYTARLLGDSIDTTIKVIDKLGFYTQSGKQRWTHTAIPQQEWNSLNYVQKRDVIKQMYQREGGSGVLTGETTGQPIPQPITSKIDEKKLRDAFTRLKLSVPEFLMAKRTFENLLSQGDLQGAWEDIVARAIQNNLSPTEREKLNDFESGTDAYSATLQFIDSNKDLKTGPYKDLFESAKPFVLIEKDPKYSQLLQFISVAEAPIRRGFFGTAVTATEGGTAKAFLLEKTDNIEIIRQKIANNIAFFKFVNDATVARTVGVPKPNLNSYLPFPNIKKQSTDSKGRPPLSSFIK